MEIVLQKMKFIVSQLGLSLLCFSFLCNSQNKQETLEEFNSSDWLIVNLLEENYEGVQVSGNPKIVDSPYGKAVYFDGVDDAFFVDANPLESLKEFTIEMIFNPSIDGDFEQRIVHMGEISGNRMLLEIRAVDNSWYFDGFVASDENKLALIDEKLIHPLGQWYHVALVVTKNTLSTYVNGNLELTEAFSFNNSINTGQSSVGVRLNKRSWFKGDIYKIRVTPKQLKPQNFMPF